MKLRVRLIEARNLPPTDPNGLSDPYVKLQLGKYRGKSKVVKKCLNPLWDEEFSFKVDDLREELTICVMDEDKYFNDDFVGQIKVSMSAVLDAENKTLGPTWYPLQPKNVKKSKYRDCGEIHLKICLSQNSTPDDLYSSSPVRRSANLSTEPSSSSISKSKHMESPKAEGENSSSPSITNRIFHFLNKDQAQAISVKEPVPSPTPSIEVDSRERKDDNDASFEDLMKMLERRDKGDVMPSNLPGGVLLDQAYLATPAELNAFLFSAESPFMMSLAEVQGTAELKIGSWRFQEDENFLKRHVTYIKAPTKLIKSVRATEEQTFLKADGNSFAILSSVFTPDVPYGSCFRTEILYCIMPSGEQQSSRLVISWRVNFVQSTILKGVIEGGAKQGMSESFAQFASLLSKNFKSVDYKDLRKGKEELLAGLTVERESDLRLAVRFLGNFTVLSTVLGVIYVLVHVLLANPSVIHGLEFFSLDLPDSIGEIIVSGAIVLLAERVLKMIGRFLQARKQKGSDHGVKAQGDGWVLTVALIEGSNLATVNPDEFSNPYVVFTCNGKTRKSSVKFQTAEPHWNEIFEFDATDDPPSTMDVNVFSFDGPYSEAISLGHAEINFLKSNLLDLADLWVPLQGKVAKANLSKLHIRIFLENTRGAEVPKDYITRMEKEVGKKIHLRSPQANSAFQKLFGLPPEEFLINDFTCHLKRKMPLQGRLFLSRRIIGFHANLFGHKTKFFFLWEDVEDIQVVSPSLASVGSPSLMFVLRKGRGTDARHGAKSQDSDGRLKFHFQSFVSFHVASRTIMALWKAKSSLVAEQKIQISEQDWEPKINQANAFLATPGTSENQMEEVFSSSYSVPVHKMIELFGGGPIERDVMSNVGCEEYSASPWCSMDGSNSEVSQREVRFKCDKKILNYGGEVTCIQRRYPLVDRNGSVVEEAMTISGVSLGNYFLRQSMALNSTEEETETTTREEKERTDGEKGTKKNSNKILGFLPYYMDYNSKKIELQ
ncbi:C2 calcium/lipid-binding and GRAM domain containing protein isoform X2 [Wolffia australiana]